MKKLLFTIAALAALVTFSPARAQGYETVTLLNITSLTTTITNSATSNYTAVVSIPKAATIGITTKQQLNGAGTSGTIFKFSKSVDGTDFETTPSLLITNATTGATAAYTYQEASVAGVKALKLVTVINGNSQALTNLYVKIGVKTLP